jgi:phosphoheptose isomerase
VPSEKLTCEFARYSVHKHFYGKPGTKFQKMLTLAGKRSGFYTVVSITVSIEQVEQCTLKTLQIPINSQRSGAPFRRPMGESSEILKNAVAGARETLQSLVHLDGHVEKAADLIEHCLRSGGKLLVCGNGGSAADASHFATEFVVRFMKDRPAYPAICLAGDGGLLTAAGNDYGFDEIFARQVAAFGLPGDLLICLTTSGKSRNIERALQEAKARKLKTITFLGRDGGSTIGMADVDLLVRGDLTARIQEAHTLLLHVLCETVEVRLIGKKKAQ